jgi:YVTN family beta-propeller protein
MKVNDRYDGSQTPFQGDHTVLLRSIPVNARIERALVTVTPVDPSGGADPFAETIRFNGATGEWGTTKTVVAQRWVEVDFHARRTLVGVRGSNLTHTTLQVDLGGAYVEINANGGIKAPDDSGPFQLQGTAFEPLPALTVTKLKLTNPVTTPPTVTSPDLTEVVIRSAPANVSLRFGDLPPFWTQVGELLQIATTPDAAAVLQAFLQDARVENGFYVVPLILHSDAIARLTVTLEIDYLVQTSVLPEGLPAVVLPFDIGTLPQAPTDVLQLTVPAGTRIAARGTTARVTGTFAETRIAYGPTGAVTVAGTAAVTSTLSQAQLIAPPADIKATAVDLLLKTTGTARLQLDLRDDFDGKPGTVSRLSGPATLALPATAAGTLQEQAASAQPRWISIPLPTEFQFRQGERYWLVLQSLEGEVAWAVAAASAGTPGMQQTQDGGLSWRATAATGVSTAGAAYFRLRHQPERFQVPIEMQVGAGDQAVRLKLDRFQPLGQVDFALDSADLAQTFNDYLAKAPAAACPAGEHLANGDFEQWTPVGDALQPAATVALNVPPVLIAIPFDGAKVYVAGEQFENTALQAIDSVCDNLIAKLDLSMSFPSALALTPDGQQAYIADDFSLRLVDLPAFQTSGNPLSLQDGGGVKALALSPDGSRLYLAEYYFIDDTHSGQLRALDTRRLQQLIRDQGNLSEAVVATHPFGAQQEPAALAVAPDGNRLYVAIVKHDAADSGEVHLLDTTLGTVATPVPAGKQPSAVALTPDGRTLLVTSQGDNIVAVIDTAAAKVTRRIAVGQGPLAVAVAAAGDRAYVASREDHSLSVIDSIRWVVTATLKDLPAPSSPTALALTPQGDKIYVALTDTAGGALAAISIGTPAPAEWTLTSGQVTPHCLPAPFQRIAVLGVRRRNGKIPATPMPTALSQVVPVAGSCTYDFSFWGIASEPDAVAEVFWLSPACGLLRTDQVPIQAGSTARDSSREAVSVLAAEATSVATPSPVLEFHRARLQAPAGATQAEVRFHVPAGIVAGIDRVSLAATAEAVANGDFQSQDQGQLREWSVFPSVAPGFAVLPGANGIQLRNAGANPAGLQQTLAVSQENQPFTLQFQGKITAGAANARIQLRWLKADSSAVGTVTILDIAPTGFGSLIANGSVPAGAVQGDIQVEVAPGTTLEVQQLSLRFAATIQAPVTFIAQAPGELTVSDWQVAFEQVEAATPSLPAGGLCTATPPDRQPGETADTCCFCPCCEQERTLTDTASVTTPAGRPAVAGNCSGCGVRLVRPGGRGGPDA